MTASEFITTAEVATLLKISVSTVQRMAREGRITALKVGKLWRFPAQVSSSSYSSGLSAEAREGISSLRTGSKRAGDAVRLVRSCLACWRASLVRSSSQ